jgi:hypothetical protein
VTRLLRFQRGQMVLNFVMAPKGSVRVEVQDADGEPPECLPAADNQELRGAAIEQTATWSAGDRLRRLAGTPGRLRFVLRDADLFSFRYC